jgi:16S rRNA (adenine1518-N6/adenine1519-N6)-dimethyltransferase
VSSHRPRKRFGQHFLHDQSVIWRIVEAIAPMPDQNLVEIGPGQGALTRPLLSRAGKLSVIEIDRDLAGEMERDLGPEGVEVIAVDALNHDFVQMGRDVGPLRIVGNLPYNISTPLIFHLLDAIGAVTDLHIMVQKEVADRMAAGPGDKAYGRLSVMVALHAQVERLFHVGPGSFRPPPRVDSTVIRISPRVLTGVDLGKPGRFDELVRLAFTQRRKTLRRILNGRIDAEGIEACGIDPRARPETLSVSEFAALAVAVDAAT